MRCAGDVAAAAAEVTSVLSLVVPAYNEAERLPPSLARMREYLDSAGEEYEVIVVDDGSSDGTTETVERTAAAGWPQLRALRLDRNQGKGAATRAGMLAARGEHRAFSDADLSTPLEELPRLRGHLEGDCQVAIASRAGEAQIEVHQALRRELMGKTYNVLLRLLVLPGIRDSQCCFNVFTDTAAVACFEPLQTPRFGFDAEVLLRARRHGWRIAEVPVRWRHVEASRVHPLRDASRMLLDLILLRLRRL
ncbi:MAG TPA: dolichyl-phosphate beta-glucosyltransferase [Candidatus Dormibacteraeota bacterium]|nr:dolichyl-phosphate beta-glucosyltransferase [Candidatus Dormibacteraeota bacterium]